MGLVTRGTAERSFPKLAKLQKRPSPGLSVAPVFPPLPYHLPSFAGPSSAAACDTAW